MKEYLDKFINEGLVYRGNKYDFLLLKDFIEFSRSFNLNVKIKSLKAVLQDAGWKHKKASMLTENGYESKDLWYANYRVEKAKSLPVKSRTRANLNEAEEIEAKRMINLIFEKHESIKDIPEIMVNEFEIIFTNKGLKELLIKMETKGSPSKLSSIIRSWSDKILLGEHFFGTSSRTILFKNYYRLNR